MSEITRFDGKVMKPLFRFLKKTGIGIPIVLLAMKTVEVLGNGFHSKGRYGRRIKWSSFKRIILIGQSHLDAAWRWRAKQGIIKARATFKKALDHIDKLSDFTYTQPSPQYYQWIKETDPYYKSKLYPRIKKAVKDGRWIIFGGSWVESDTNLPCGESLVRQRFYGQRFYLNEFGRISDVEFLMDCFGFNWNLPQIYKKSGAKMFGTGKLFWNKKTKIPIGMCLWEGPDGTRLPMVHINFGYFLPITIGKDYPLIYLLGKPGKQLIADYGTPPEAFNEWRSDELMLEQPFGYGLGDGGHGPIEAELLVVDTLKKLLGKRVKHHQYGDLYAMFKKYFKRWAIWRDEWYLDLHRGTYTSVSIVKRGNRESENRLIDLEKRSSMMDLMNQNDQDFMGNSFEKVWKIVLFNQFHDIIPGSSCPEVYEDYKADLERIFDFIRERQERIYYEIFNANKEELIKIDHKLGGKVFPFVVFNTFSWERNEIIELSVDAFKNGAIYDIEGKNIKSVITRNEWGDWDFYYKSRLRKDKFNRVLFLPPNPLKPFSFNIFFFKFDGEKSNIDNKEKNENKFILQKVDGKIGIENEYIRVVIDTNTGLIKSYYDKSLGFELFSEPGNKILIFNELKGSDAWNIDPEYERNIVDYDLTNCTVNVIENNFLRKTIKVTRKISRSIFNQYIIVYVNKPFVELNYTIDLKDPRWLIKIDLPTNLISDKVAAEIPYAYIERSINPRTKIESARWEQSCQKWISIYDNKEDISFSVINNGKYGFNSKKDRKSGKVNLRPTLLRSPVFTGYAPETLYVRRAPDGGLDPEMPHFTDLEVHRDIGFIVTAHRGDWRKGAWRIAYEYNIPLKEKIEGDIWKRVIDNGDEIKFDNKFLWHHSESLFKVKTGGDHIRFGAIKLYEDYYKNRDKMNLNRPLIFRVVEVCGYEGIVKIEVDKKLKILNVWEVDLLEINIDKKKEIKMEEKTFKFDIKPYEIKTILVDFRLIDSF